MRYVFRLILLLALLGGLSVVAFAYFGDMSPDQTMIESPMTVEVD